MSSNSSADSGSAMKHGCTADPKVPAHLSGRTFPVLTTLFRRSDLEALALAKCPSSVPWALVEPHAWRARENHQQSLERLAERGGLDPTELVAVLEDRRWTRMDLSDAARRLNEFVHGFELAQRTGER